MLLLPNISWNITAPCITNNTYNELAMDINTEYIANVYLNYSIYQT